MADESTWNRLKSIARGVANAFLLHDDATRVGLITYSTQPKLELRFDEKNDRDEFSDFLNTVTSTHGTPNLEQALALANDKLFAPSAGMRTKVSSQELRVFFSAAILSPNGHQRLQRSSTLFRLCFDSIDFLFRF